MNLFHGLTQVIMAPFQILQYTLAGTLSGPPVIGTAFGAVTGAATAVGSVVSGTFETVGSLVPLAQKAAPFLLPFLF